MAKNNKSGARPLLLFCETFAEQPDQSNSATCAVNLIFPKRKRRENNTSSQEIARKIM